MSPELSYPIGTLWGSTLNKNVVSLRSFFTAPHPKWPHMNTTTLLRSQGTLYPALYRPLHPGPKTESTETARKQQGNKGPHTIPAPELIASKHTFVGNFVGNFSGAARALNPSTHHGSHRSLPHSSANHPPRSVHPTNSDQIGLNLSKSHHFFYSDCIVSGCSLHPSSVPIRAIRGHLVSRFIRPNSTKLDQIRPLFFTRMLLESLANFAEPITGQPFSLCFLSFHRDGSRFSQATKNSGPECSLT